MTKTDSKKPITKKSAKKSTDVTKSKLITSKKPKERKSLKPKVLKGEFNENGGHSKSGKLAKKIKVESRPKTASSTSSSTQSSSNSMARTKKPKKQAVPSEQQKPNVNQKTNISSLAGTVLSSSPSSSVQQFEQTTRIYAHAYEDPNWLGNEDDNGSVASGLLEEDFCLVCGHSTLGSDTWNSVVLCDICEGEYHLQCIGLSKLPPSAFICQRCEVEEQVQKNLRYTVEMFPLDKPKPADKKVIVYTPARPVEVAFKECETMGIMLVSNVFDFETLTHGTLSNTTKSGRIVEEWLGVTREVDKRLSATTVTNIVDRDGRYDLKLPDFVVEQLNLSQRLEPILEKLRTIMGSTPKLRTHNVVFVPVSSRSQEWHYDHSMVQKKPFRYFTILIHLNSLDNRCGGTEIWIDSKKKGDLVRARPADALVFHGSLMHRGLGNSGFSHRFFYYASYACDADINDGTG